MSFSEYKDIFVSEAKEYLQNLNELVLELEENPEKLYILDEMFRAAHSLKGMAGTMGYDQIACLTHQMESVFDELREGKIRAEKRVIDLLFGSLDVLENLLNQVVEGMEEEDVSELIARLGDIIAAETGNIKTAEEEMLEGSGIKQVGSPEKEIKKAGGKGEQVYLVTVKLVKECLLKSVRAYMVLKEIKNLGKVIKTVPSEQDLEDDNFGDSFQVIFETCAKPDLISNSVSKIAEIEKVTVESCGVPEPKKKKSSLLEEQQKALFVKTSEKIIRVETEKMDMLISLAGELVVNRTRVIELSKSLRDPELRSALEQLDLITTNLQNAVMKLRMVHIKQVFDRFPRLVRDFSQARNKKVNLILEGEETELDRSIVNIIGEPLVHLVRNAMDHGIEKPADRKRLNKPETATIKLSARHEGSHVVIEVEDDGRGIDPQKIKKKAEERGLKTSEELNKMSDDEIVKLIFSSGFSTAEEVTDISGRGVGMDAVKFTIETLHGEINVDTKVEKGTKFIIKLPLTLAIIKAMLVKVGEDIFAVPIESIRENIYVSPRDIKKVQSQRVISFRDEVLQLISLKNRFNMAEKETPAPDDVYPVVVVEVGSKKAGLIVDNLLGQQEIVIKSLGKILEGLSDIAGATVLANGEVALILDVSSLISAADTVSIRSLVS